MINTPAGSIVTALSESECRTVLGRNQIGRLCFLNDGSVDVEPVPYVFADGWLFVRGVDGTTLEAFAQNSRVAFEVDENGRAFDWRSVVARGTISLVPEHGRPCERDDFERVLGALRAVMFSEPDAIARRAAVYGIHVDVVTGRMAALRNRRSTRHPLGNGTWVHRVRRTLAS